MPSPEYLYRTDTLRRVEAPNVPEVLEFKKQLQEQQDALSELKTKLQKLRTGLKNSKTLEKIKALEAKKLQDGLSPEQIAALDALIAANKAEFDAEKRKLQKFELAIQKLAEKIATIQAEMDRLEAAYKDLQFDLHQTEEIKRSLDENVAEFTGVAGKLQAVTDDLPDLDFTDLEKELLEEDDRNRMSGQKGKLLTIKGGYDREIARITAEIAGVMAEIEEIRKDMEVVEADIAQESVQKTLHEGIETRLEGGKEDVRKKIEKVIGKKGNFLEINTLLEGIPGIRAEFIRIYEELGRLAVPGNLKKLDARYLKKLADLVSKSTGHSLGMLHSFALQFGLPSKMLQSIEKKQEKKLNIDEDDPRESILSYLAFLDLDSLFPKVIAGLEKKVSLPRFQNLLDELQVLATDYVKTKTALEKTFQTLLDKKGVPFTMDYKKEVEALKKTNDKTLMGGLLEAVLVYCPSASMKTLESKLKTGSLELQLQQGPNDLGTFTITKSADDEYLIDGNEPSIDHPLIRHVRDENQSQEDQMDSEAYDRIPLEIRIS